MGPQFFSLSRGCGVLDFSCNLRVLAVAFCPPLGISEGHFFDQYTHLPDQKKKKYNCKEIKGSHIMGTDAEHVLSKAWLQNSLQTSSVCLVHFLSRNLINERRAICSSKLSGDKEARPNI